MMLLKHTLISCFVFRNRTSGQISKRYEFTLIGQNLTQKTIFEKNLDLESLGHNPTQLREITDNRNYFSTIVDIWEIMMLNSS